MGNKNGLISELDVCYLKHKTLVSPVQEYCEHNQIKLHPWPPDLKMVENSYDFGVVASFGRLIPSKIIQSFPRGIINVHGSILPRWRGAAPVMHAIKWRRKERNINCSYRTKTFRHWG